MTFKFAHVDVLSADTDFVRMAFKSTLDTCNTFFFFIKSLDTKIVQIWRERRHFEKQQLMFQLISQEHRLVWYIF